LMVSALMMLAVMGSLPKIALAQNARIDDLIANAKSPEDHEKAAKFFDEQAAKAEQAAEWHKRLLKVYKTDPRFASEQAHCGRLVGVYKNDAKEDRALAQEYRHMK